jgi:hypothetical protein
MAGHAHRTISDRDFERHRRLLSIGNLNSKEELFYYRISSEQFGDKFDPALVGRTKAVPVV